MTGAFGIQKFLLPEAERDRERRSGTSGSVLWPAGWYTFTEAFWGFGRLRSRASSRRLLARPLQALGSALDAVLHRRECDPDHRLRTDRERLVRPVREPLEDRDRGLLCFLPVMVNTLRGLHVSAKPRQIELMRSYAAGELTIWRRVRIPTSLPFVFTALKIASVLAMIGAIVGEYFGGAHDRARVRSTTPTRRSSSSPRRGRDPRRFDARNGVLPRRVTAERAIVRCPSADAGLVMEAVTR